jgi:hypothetical protein
LQFSPTETVAEAVRSGVDVCVTVGVAVLARTGVGVDLVSPSKVAVVAEVSIWLDGPLTVRVNGTVWLGSLPAVENMPAGALGEYVTAGPAVVVGPAVIGVSKEFSARDVRSGA